MATTLRNDAKNEIMKILREQGYPTYAKLVSYFDINASKDYFRCKITIPLVHKMGEGEFL